MTTETYNCPKCNEPTYECVCLGCVCKTCGYYYHTAFGEDDEFPGYWENAVRVDKEDGL